MSLITSILTENEHAVARFLQMGEPVDFVDDYGFTPLIEACIMDHYPIAAMLLEAGADPNYEDEHGGTALSWAAENNNLNLAKLLLSKGANPNAYTLSSQPVITMPILRKQKKMRQLLYQQGADIKFAEDYINAKLLGHRFQLIGKVDLIDNKKKFTEVNFEGFILEFTLDVVFNSLYEFCSNFGSRKLKQYHPIIHVAADAIANAQKLIRYQQYRIDVRQHKRKIDAYLNKELLVIPVAFEGHAITFVKYGNILVKCDRQNDMGVNDNVVFYQMNHAEVCDMNFLKGLMYRKNASDYITDYMPKKLGLVPLDKLDIPAQISGNCSWANVEACVPAMIYLALQKENPYARNKNKNIAMMIYHTWQRWDQDRALYFCIHSFHQDHLLGRASKAEMLAMILVQGCHYSSPEDLIRAKKILDILMLPQYEYILKNLIKVYCYSNKSDDGQNLMHILDYYNYAY